MYVSLGKFCKAYLLLSQSFKFVKLLFVLKPSHSRYWEFLGIYLDFRAFKLPQIQFPEIPKNSTPHKF